MVSDGLLLVGILIVGIGLFWWHPPAAVTAFGLLLIAAGLTAHQGGTNGKAD
jgi:hypothetical protein